jgi:hypothetical protein
MKAPPVAFTGIGFLLLRRTLAGNSSDASTFNSVVTPL